MITAARERIPLEIKSVSDGGADSLAICSFEGEAGCYLNIDGWGDILDTGSFSSTVAYTKSSGVIRSEHAVTTGKIMDAVEIASGLAIKGEIYDTAAGRDQKVMLKTGTITGLSIGWNSNRKDRYYLEGKDAVQQWWATKGYTPTDEDLANLEYWGGARVVTKAKVYEVSTTWLPANTSARVTQVKGAPRAGRSFDEQVSQVLDTLEDMVERTQALSEKSVKAGRGVSHERKVSLKAMSGRIDALLQAMDAKSQPEEPAIDTVGLYAQFLEISSRITGIGV